MQRSPVPHACVRGQEAPREDQMEQISKMTCSGTACRCTSAYWGTWLGGPRVFIKKKNQKPNITWSKFQGSKRLTVPYAYPRSTGFCQSWSNKSNICVSPLGLKHSLKKKVPNVSGHANKVENLKEKKHIKALQRGKKKKKKLCYARA